MESYQPKDIKLFKYCETFFKKALVVLEQYIEAGAYIPLITYYKPVARTNNDGNGKITEYVPYEDRDFVYIVCKCYNKLLDLPELKTAKNYILEKRYLVIGGSNFAPSVLLTQALIYFLKKTGCLNYREKEFADIYANIENLIFHNEFQFRTTAKLNNFSYGNGLIELDKMHLIKRYTQQDCEEIYRHPSINIYDHTLPLPGDFKIEIEINKDKSNWGTACIEGKDAVKCVLTALRLFKDSEVGIATLENEPITWFPFTSKCAQLLPPPKTGELCSISETEIPELIHLWQIIKSANDDNCPSLNIAIKRFNYAHDHKNREDALIDIMIGLEALYMMKDERSELRYKLTLRVATFLEASLSAHKGRKEAIFDAVYEAYKLRSNVVHGSKVADAEIWKCRIVKTYLSDSIKQFARLSRKYKHKQVLNKIDKCIKSGETLGAP
ncbi:MAG: hypothetical protein KKD16_05735 [Proteobacteria bacterium]|nr:hypothetical protein [Pseudomonadota bacterium]MBU4127039.1 hypothetical protein [Pseudomonadota bacterium]